MSALSVTPFAGPFGARIDGARLAGADDIDPSHAAALQAALAEHHVLLIAGQTLTDEEFARFGLLFGPPIEFFNPRDRDRAVPAVIHIRNSPATPERLRDGAMHWHQDSSYEDPPAAVTMLAAVEAPAGRNETLFADLAAAFDALPADEQARLSALRVVHDRRGCPPEWLFPDEKRGAASRDEAVATVTHPLVVRHPVTGRPALYGIAGTPVGIVGMAEGEARELLTALKRRALAPQFCAAATADAGAVLVWDNMAVMHRATPTEYSDEPGHRRIVRRISTIVDPTFWKALA